MPIIFRQGCIRIPYNIHRRVRLQREVLPDIVNRILHPNEIEFIDSDRVTESKHVEDMIIGVQG